MRIEIVSRTDNAIHTACGEQYHPQLQLPGGPLRLHHERVHPHSGRGGPTGADTLRGLRGTVAEVGGNWYPISMKSMCDISDGFLTLISRSAFFIAFSFLDC